MSQIVYGTCATCHGETEAPYPGPPRCRVCSRPRVRRSVRLTSDTPAHQRPLYRLHLEGDSHMPSVDGLTWAECETLACAWLAGGER